MNRILTILFLSLFAFGFVLSQEVVKPLEYNSDLYWKHHKKGSNKTIWQNYLFLSDTLSLPFIDDFSKNYLRTYHPEDFVIATINRSVELGAQVDSFKYMNTPSWNYTYNTGTGEVDSTQKSQIQLILYDGANPLIPTDTFTGWPDYYNNYEFDSAGNAIDSSYVEPDSAIGFSEFKVVKDLRALWEDNYVYLNNTYPLNPISYGVATFDGLDQFGMPHNKGGNAFNGPADSLTSKPIDLSGFDAFSGVYLSFFYQRKGLGDSPEETDSLVVEFKIAEDTWRQVWGVSGTSLSANDSVFKPVIISLDDPFYFNSTFQFRFRNYASIAGNNDHWHIDYVYMNNNRDASDTLMNDRSVLGPPTNFLSNYTAMPWHQFQGFEGQESKDDLTVSYRNNNSDSQQSMDFTFQSEEGIGNIPLGDSTLTLSPFPTYSNFSKDYPTFAPRIIDTTQLPAGRDSVTIKLKSFFNALPSNLTSDNDTAELDVHLHNYYAYDDGTAERAYGLEGPGLKKFAYEFNLNKPDTLRAIQIHFTHVDFLFTFEEFTLFVWDSIDVDQNTEDTLYAKSGRKFYYIDERNGFATYVLDSPLVVQDKFYIGWAQLLRENTQIGLDLNNVATEHMFVYIQNVWLESSIAGAPMIRPILGKDIPIQGTPVKEPVKQPETFMIYPNPVINVLYLDASFSLDGHALQIFDLQGKLIRTTRAGSRRVDVTGLKSGLYFLRIVDKERKAHTVRFVKM